VDLTTNRDAKLKKKQNGFGEKRGMVKLNRLSDHKMGESCESGKRKSAEVLKSKRLRESRERESAKGSENSVRIVAPAARVLGCLTVRASRNSIFVQQCRHVLPSPLALPFFIALASLRAVASLLALVSLLVSADLLQGSHSQAETHMRGERVRRKIASRESRASEVQLLPALLGRTESCKCRALTYFRLGRVVPSRYLENLEPRTQDLARFSNQGLLQAEPRKMM